MSDKKLEGDGMINERITIRLPEDIIQKLDEIIRAEGYSNRSEFIRKTIVDLINARSGQPEKVTSQEEARVDLAKDSNSRKVTVELSEDIYVALTDMQSRGIFHGPLDVILSNEIERVMLRHLRELKEAREKDAEIINSEKPKVVK
ncbi:MAG: ribbon-helix-helix domain-containing protein [Thermoplasmata archaeon]|nr:ribbon-helix-helix domain-containing protein [Thermoplasmata archaeon]